MRDEGGQCEPAEHCLPRLSGPLHRAFGAVPCGREIASGDF